MVLPCHQRRGLGHFMISLSYGLSKLEKKCGTPETPLSDLGLISYRKYWASNLLQILYEYSIQHKSISIDKLSQLTSFTKNDIFYTLHDCGVLQQYKYIKKKKPNNLIMNNENNNSNININISSNNNNDIGCVFAINKDLINKFIRKKRIFKPNDKRIYINVCNERKIHWTPHYFNPNSQI